MALILLFIIFNSMTTKRGNKYLKMTNNGLSYLCLILFLIIFGTLSIFMTQLISIKFRKI